MEANKFQELSVEELSTINGGGVLSDILEALVILIKEVFQLDNKPNKEQ